MVDSRALFRIREGAFTYLLAADRTASIEHRSGGALEMLEDTASPLAAWYRTGDRRVPVVRLGRLMQTRAGAWAYALLLSDGPERIGVAAEHVHLIADGREPAIQAFNPVGCSLPGGPVITGVCPGTEPEYLVLDAPRFQACLRRAAQG